MKISEILDSVYDEDVGWRAASRSVKPVHVANGLARALRGAYFDMAPLNRFLVWEKYSQALPDRTFDAIMSDDLDETFKPFKGRADKFDRARRYAHGLLGADKGLFPSEDKSSLSLTCGAMVTRDNNDRGSASSRRRS